MNARAAILALLVSLPFTGSVSVRHADSTGGFTPSATEVPFGVLAAGTSVGTAATNATASLAGALVSTRTDLFYLNNTSATGAYWAKIVLTSSSGLSSALVALEIGIDNGTASTSQVAATLGSITQSSGAYVRLPPASTNRIYVVHTVTVLFGTGVFGLDVYAADDASESAVVRTRAALTLT